MSTEYKDEEANASTHDNTVVRHDSDLSGEQSYETEKGVMAEEAANIPWTFTRIIAIASLCVVNVGAQIILYMTGGSLSYIAPDIGTYYPNWLLTANTLAVTAICPFVGYITDLLGRRWVAIIGTIGLVIGSVVQATSKSLGSSVTAQAFGGIGAGICELTAVAGVAEITPVRWRGLTISLLTFAILPFIPYFLYIEELQAHATWRWALGMSAIWSALGAVGLLFCYRPPPRHNVDDLSTKQILHRIDWGGAFISISGITLFLVGLQYGGYQVPWTEPKAMATLIIGIVLILIFPVYELYVPKHPMVPALIFKGQYVVTISYIISFISGMLFYSVLGFFPLMLQNLYDAPPHTTGLRGLGYPLAILSGACTINSLISYTKGHIRGMFVVAAVIMTAFSGALATSTPYNPEQATALATLASFGIGAVILPAMTVALYACPDAYIGTTASLSLSVRFLGGSVGTAIYYAIYESKYKVKLPAYVIPALTQLGLPPNAAQMFVTALQLDPSGAKAMMVPGITKQMVLAGSMQARRALAESLMYVWYTTIPFGVIAIVACAFLPNLRTYMTNRVAVHIH